MALTLDNARVEIAWTTANPLTASPAWEDMTPFTALEAGITWNRGRSDETSAVSPGQCTVTLRNDDGAFTPGRSGSSRYPNITIGKRMRVTARVGSNPGNFLAAEDASFEGGTTGSWTPAGGVIYTNGTTVANSSTRAQDGTKSLLITWPTTSGSPAATLLTISGLTIGRAYCLSMYVYVPGGSPVVTIGFNGSPASAPPGYSMSTSTTGSFQRIAAWFTASASTYTLVTSVASATAGQQAWVDAVQVDEGSAPVAFTTAAPPIFGRFDGIINSIAPILDQFGSAAVITATDMLKAIGELAPLRSMLEQEVLADSPLGYWRLSEPTTSGTAGDVSGSLITLTPTQRGAGGTLTFGTGTGPGYDGLTAATLSPASTSNGLYLAGTAPSGNYTMNGSTGTTLEAFINTSTAAAQIIAKAVGAAGQYLSLEVSAAGKLVAGISDPLATPTLTTLTSASNVTGGTKEASVTLSLSGGTVTMTLYLDGANAGSTTYTAPSIPSFTNIYIGGGASDALLTATVSHVAIFGTALSATRVLAHRNAGLTGFTGELSGTRAARLLGYVLPAGLINCEAGSSTVGPQATTGVGALAASQIVATSENGVLFAAADGRITFHGRAHRYGEAAAITADVEADLGSTSFPVVVSDQFLANDITVTRYGGATQRAVNSSSVTSFGPRVTGVSTILDTDSGALDAANWYANINASPAARVAGLVFDMLTTTSAAKDLAIMGLDVSARADVSNLPSTAAASTAQFYVEGVSESISISGWQTTFTTSPLGQSGSVFVLDDAVYGHLDTGGVLAY